MGLRTLENFLERRFFGIAAPVPYTGGTPVLPFCCAAGEGCSVRAGKVGSM
jgi:hypothetical protein